jgi:small-conductance mechanosensitive channel
MIKPFSPQVGTWSMAIALLVSAFMLLTPAPVAMAQDDGRATVRLDGRSLFRVGAGQDTGAAVRARRIEARLAGLLQDAATIRPAEVRPHPEGLGVVVAGVPVAVVLPADAEAAGLAPGTLATRWAEAVDAALSQAATRRLSAGARFLTEIEVSIIGAAARLGESAIFVVPRALAAVLVVATFWAIARLLRFGLRALFSRIVEDVTVESLVKQVVYYAVIGLGLVIAADAFGFSPETVVTGLGLTGLALGFALRDILSNFVSGILLLWLRPFKIGDQVQVGDAEGTVERIELRATLIRAYDGRVVLVPNAEVFTSRIVNNTADPVRRGSVSVPLGYGEDLRQAAAVLEAAARSAEGVLADQPVAVRVAELGAAEMVLDVTFWADSRRRAFGETSSAVRAASIEALRRAGIGLPNPDLRLLAPQDAAEWASLIGAHRDRPPHPTDAPPIR